MNDQKQTALTDSEVRERLARELFKAFSSAYVSGARENTNPAGFSMIADHVLCLLRAQRAKDAETAMTLSEEWNMKDLNKYPELTLSRSEGAEDVAYAIESSELVTEVG